MRGQRPAHPDPEIERRIREQAKGKFIERGLSTDISLTIERLSGVELDELRR